MSDINTATDAVERLGEAIQAMADAALNAMRAMGEMIREAFSPMLPSLRLLMAMEWAKTNRPKWYHMATRCKKKRVRKKYINRIMRDWEKARDKP